MYSWSIEKQGQLSPSMQNFKLTYFTVGNQITSIHDNYAPVYKSQKIDIHEQYYVRKILMYQF